MLVLGDKATLEPVGMYKRLMDECKRLNTFHDSVQQIVSADSLLDIVTMLEMEDSLREKVKRPLNLQTAEDYMFEFFWRVKTIDRS